MGQGASASGGEQPAEWYSAVCDLHPDGLLVADDQGLIVYVNARAAFIVQTPIADLLGKDIRTAIPLQENDGRSWWACTDPWNGLAIRSQKAAARDQPVIRSSNRASRPAQPTWLPRA